MFLAISFVLLSFFNSNDSLEVTAVTSTRIGKISAFEIEFFERLIQFHNDSNKTKLVVNRVFVKTYNDVWNVLEKQENKLSVGLAAATITNSPKFAFSRPYFPTISSLIRRVETGVMFDKEKSIKLGYLDIPYYKSIVDSLSNLYAIEKYPIRNFSKMRYALRSKKIDGFIGDAINGWLSLGLEVSVDVEESTKFIGFLFLKDSELKKVLDPTIKKFLSTVTFQRLLQKYFTNTFPDYYKTAMRDVLK